MQGRKSKRRRDPDAESTGSKASGYSGIRALEHYLLCFQLVLRKQVTWLVNVVNLPADLETLVKDLWVLRLHKLQSRVTTVDSGTDTEGKSQLFSSQSEGESSHTTASRRIRKGHVTDGAPNLLEAVALCYVGLLLMREPVTVAALHGWASDGSLLYFRAAKEVPLAMRDRLPATYQDLLEPRDIGPAQKLHQSVLNLVVGLHADTGMEVPPINHPLILYRWVSELTLPIEVYTAALRLGRGLEFDFAFLKSPEKRSNVVLRSPEVRLMCLLVIATKLLFPLDGVDRSVPSASDLSALKFDWVGWSNGEAAGIGRSPGTMTFEQAASITTSEALHANDRQLDEYLDWFEHNIATEQVRDHGKAGQDANFRRNLFDLFPVERKPEPPGKSQSQTATMGTEDRNDVQAAQSRLEAARMLEADEGQHDTLRHGRRYRRYRAVNELDGAVKLLLQRCADMVGLTLDAMVGAVFAVERKMQLVEEKLRKLGEDVE